MFLELGEHARGWLLSCSERAQILRIFTQTQMQTSRQTLPDRRIRERFQCRSTVIVNPRGMQVPETAPPKRVNKFIRVGIYDMRSREENHSNFLLALSLGCQKNLPSCYCTRTGIDSEKPRARINRKIPRSIESN